MSNLSNFYVYLDSEGTKCENVKFRQFFESLIRPVHLSVVKWNIKRSCSGNGTVIINIGQCFKFAVSNSTPIAHFCKRSEDPPRRNGYNRTDIVEFGPIPKQFWFIMAQSYREVTIMNQDFIVIGQTSVRSPPLCPLRHCLFQERLQNLAFWAELDAINLKSCSFGHRTVNTALSSPLRVRYVVSFVNLKTAACSRSIETFLYSGEYGGLETNAIFILKRPWNIAVSALEVLSSQGDHQK